MKVPFNFIPFFIIVFVGFLLESCENVTNVDQEQNQVHLDTLDGYFSFEGEQGFFADCHRKKLFQLSSDSILNQLRIDCEGMNPTKYWIAGSGVFDLRENEGNESLSLLGYFGLSKSAFCPDEVIFFTLENKFLGIEKGVTIEEVGLRYGPIIATKPKDQGGVYTDQFDMHMVKKTAMVTFFTDEDKKIQHYEVRDPDIYLTNGVHTGMNFEELKPLITDLSIKGEARYGLVTLRSEQMNLDFILTQDYEESLQSIEDIDPKSRLYLIRY